MMLTLKGILTAKEAIIARKALADAEFMDGKTSAGIQARKVKENLQNDKKSQEVEKLVMDKLLKHPMFMQAALPKKIMPLLLSKYSGKMKYDTHVDDAIMGRKSGNMLRTDLSLTLFLSDPKSYDGGELEVETPMGKTAVKLPAGDAVLYPSNNWHQVLPVTKGERLAAVTWIQSMVRDPWQRNVLFDLGMVQRWALQKHPDEKETLFLSKIQSDLLRMWSDV